VKTRSQRAVENTNRKNPDGILDPLTASQFAQSWEHHAIHEGLAYSASFANDLPAGEDKSIEIHIPAHKEMHLKEIRVWTTVGEALVTLLENPAIGNPSAVALPAINRNRAEEHADKESFVDLFRDPTAVSGGEALFGVSIGAGGTGISAGSEKETEDREWLLGDKPSESVYVLKFESLDTKDARLSYSLFWYEIEEED
jgi:hypothetical protein